MVLKGGGRGPTKLGVVPLSNGPAEVALIGDGVTRVKLGDRLIGTFHPRWFGGPVSADYLTDRLGAKTLTGCWRIRGVERGGGRAAPKHLSFEEAATLPCAAVTAWVALTRHRRVAAGDKVSTQGSGGDWRTKNDRKIAEGLGRRRTVRLIGASLSPSGIMLDTLLLTGRGITVGSISVGSRGL